MSSVYFEAQPGREAQQKHEHTGTKKKKHITQREGKEKLVFTYSHSKHGPTHMDHNSQNAITF